MENSLLHTVKFHFISLLSIPFVSVYVITQGERIHHTCNNETQHIYPLAMFRFIILLSRISIKSFIQTVQRRTKLLNLFGKCIDIILAIAKTTLIVFILWYFIHLWQNNMRTRVCIWLLSLQEIINFSTRYCVHKLHLKLIRLTFNSIETSVLHSTVWYIYSMNYSSSAEMLNYYFICHQNSCSKHTNKQKPPSLIWPLNWTFAVLKHKSLCTSEDIWQRMK